MKILEQWRRLDLTAESRAKLDDLLSAERDCALDTDSRDALLEAFMGTLTEAQLMVFARVVRELTNPVH